MAQPVVFVIGATGNVGSATVASLSAKYADKVEIRAGVRNPEKADKIRSLAGVTVVQATMGDEKLVPVFRGVDTLLIVTPPPENRAQLVLSTAQAAKEAGVRHIAVISVSTADKTDTIYGRQFTEIEDRVSQLGVPYTFIRLPGFMENFRNFKGSISSQGVIVVPTDPDKPFSTVANEDAGNLTAAILVDPARYAHRVVEFASDCHTLNDLVRELSAVLGKEIKYVRVTYEDTKKFMLGMGMLQWQVDTTMELYKLIDAGDVSVAGVDLKAYRKITGEQPTDLKTWLSKVGAGFYLASL